MMQRLPVIVDLEASGFGVGSYPIEIGVALSNGQTACFLICPHSKWNHWDSSSEALHGLTRTTLQRFGSSVREVAYGLNQLLAGQVVYSDAWAYDQTWLALMFDSAEMGMHFRVEAIQSLFSEQHYMLWNQVLAEVFSECDIQRHRASNDARAIQLAYQRSTQLAAAGEPCRIRS